MSQRQPSEIFMTTKTHSTNCDNKLRELLESMDSLHPQLPEASASPDSLHAEVRHLLSDYFFVPEAWNIFICFFILPGTAWTIGQYGEGSRSVGGISQTHGGHAACRGKFWFFVQISFWPFAILIPVYFLTSWLNRGKTTVIGDWRDRWAHSAVHQIGGEVTTWPVITGTEPTHSWLSASRVMFLFLVQFFLPFALNFIICLFRLNRVSQACPPPRSVPRKCPLTRPHGEKERETHSENPPVSSIIYLFQLYCKFEN